MFVTARVDLLLATIVGRASRLVTVRPAPDDDRAAGLVAAGAEPAVAAKAVHLAGPLTTLAAAGAADPAVLADARSLASGMTRCPFGQRRFPRW